MTGLHVDLHEVTVDFGDTRALDGVTVEFPANTITGLLGRNGSGKTTMLSTIASLLRPTRGQVRAAGADPFENQRLMEQICLIRGSGDVVVEVKIATTLELVAAARPTWDADFAAELLDVFDLDPTTKPRKLSRGKRSALGAVIGLAARAPVTMFDEVHLGMDAPTRRRFYDLLLSDYIDHPRTIVISSHIISEVEQLFERVVILDEGRVLVAEDADQLRERGATITGPTDAVEAATAGLHVLSHHTLGPTTQVTVIGGLDGPTRARLRGAGLELGAVPIEDLFIAMTDKEASR